MKKKVAALILITVFMVSCQQKQDTGNQSIAEPKRQPPKTIGYRFENARQWLQNHRTDSLPQQIAFAVNRTDSSNFSLMDSVLIPVDLTGDIVYYLPFPLTVPYLKDVHKIIYFSYPTQTFAAYERGSLIYTGPTNMGRKNDLTPIGLFFTNWKAEETTSTFNDEWNLRWNYNIVNTEGIGWHQYNLPGYPASHSCLRLQEKDAHYLYTWADQWVLQSKDSIRIKGTPVIVFGAYNFNAVKPWLQLIANPHVLDITKDEIQQVTAPFLNKIMEAQKNRVSFQANKQTGNTK